MLAGFRQNLLQHRKEKMDHLQRSCEQKHLRLGGIQDRGPERDELCLAGLCLESANLAYNSLMASLD